ncbi:MULTISPECIES: hypothetical protein [unclassified Moorena]|uniref:hypothetical protein n=1 Tax=unclassified Moorena TaxID=2683338 RepID=UPI0013CD7E0B|nr:MULTISPECIES: hypothetical protein [unclassified Moorena]NEO14590.1 hypothetical protein [Moorena sp. SIO3E8]NEO25210.1 hypothetical protein [Moorena sp. SIO4A5]NEQ02364.1 hypothetical protein [Moorena sp. SIO3F7]
MNIESKHSAFSSQRSAYFIQKQLVAWHRLWPWPLATRGAFGHAVRTTLALSP